MMDIGTIEQHIARLLSITSALAESAVQLLQQLPQALEDISTDFSTLSHHFRIIDFLQRNSIGSTRPTIAEACARLDVAKEHNVELDCDHTQFWDFGDGDSTTELICANLEGVTSIGLDRRFNGTFDI
ncbi:hypothetical protein J3459_012364 [Metarhizium acridum]|nr:hypothetical protein J3459_012364 [Metarhizium acridum]